MAEHVNLWHEYSFSLVRGFSTPQRATRARCVDLDNRAYKALQQER